MRPVNTKSMFAMICSTMEKLDKGTIDVASANAMGKLVGQANNLLNYELKRAIVLSDRTVKSEHRNLELKNFDSIT